MADAGFAEKTEKPTPKKREETREKGQVAKSRELPSVTVLLSGLISLGIFGSYSVSQIQDLMKRIFSNPSLGHATAPDFMQFAQDIILAFIMIVAPLLAVVVIAAVLSNIVQVGFLLSGELIKPKLSKLDPLKGLARLFSMQSVMELIKSLLKLVIVGVTAYFSIRAEMENVSVLGDMELASIAYFILVTFFKIFLKCSLAMVGLVLIDYAFQRWDFEKRIRMTKQEIKEEFKRTEGDPLIKSRIRSIQMEMARKRMMQAVPQADVIITNPTHFAVALKYDSVRMNAPKVVAKGAGNIAGRIKELAVKYDVPIVENKPLARSLYQLVDIGREIPATLYQAVAEVLAYIYKLKGK